MSDNQVIPEAAVEENVRMEISDEAVEAAAKVLGYDPDWDSNETDREENKWFLSRARQMLEAAAPHMLAAAWREGAQVGFDSTAEGFNGECAFDHCAPDNYPPTNPYDREPWEVASYEP